MRAHVVIMQPRGDWVLARFAQYLAKFNEGGSLGDTPRAKVDVNIFIPYLEWRFSKWKRTPTALFFTHRELGNPMKEKWWKIGAKAATWRITMAEQYASQLEGYGPTVNVTPPVELKFKPTSRPMRERPLIGISGSVYKGGRKGEDLVLKLHRDHGHEWDLTASGKRLAKTKEWPIPSRDWPWREMPRFYQGLDVFLCTSRIEGGPVTVLEALACGRPVVIPRGVGLLDELPTRRSGIYRYDVGDYPGMIAALQRALKSRADPDRLWAIVKERTPERYAHDWAAALTTARVSKPKPKPKPRPAPKEVTYREGCGVAIVAYAKHAHDCAWHLIKSIHKYSPGIPVALVCEGYKEDFLKCQTKRATDEPISRTAFAKVLGPRDVVIPVIMHDRRARFQKTLLWELLPVEWEQVIYLDADILVTTPLDPIYDILEDGFDFVFTFSPPRVRGHGGEQIHHAQREKYPEENAYTNRELLTNKWMQIAGGVWGFRRTEAARVFLETFHNEWRRFGHKDQQAFERAWFKHPPRAWFFGTEWNTFVHHGSAKRSVGVYHFATAARAWTEKHDGRRLWREFIRKV